MLRRRAVPWLVAAPIALLGVASVILPSTAQDDESSAAPTSVGAGDEERSTPYSRYLGFDDPRRAAERSTASLSDEQRDLYDELWDEVEASRDALYQGLARDPRAIALQEEWRACLLDRGHDYPSPMAVDAAVHGIVVPKDVEDLEAAARSCDELVADAGAALVEEYEPPWIEANRDLLDRAERISRGR